MAIHPATQLRAQIEAGRIVEAPGAYDALSARLVERAGFPAIYLTGFGATAARLGEPDLGLLTQTEMTTHARDMVRAVRVPVIADADTGYGGPSNIERTVREHVQAGVAAIHLEDQALPKRCGQMAGVRLVDARESERRLRCALAARGGAELLVIARTDALPAAGIAEAVDRARRYQDAGADLVFVDGIKTLADGLRGRVLRGDGVVQRGARGRAGARDAEARRHAACGRHDALCPVLRGGRLGPSSATRRRLGRAGVTT